MPNACALSLFTFSPIAPFKEPIPSSSFTRFSFLSFPKSLGGSPTRLFRIAVNASGSDNFITDDAFGDYPWDSSGSSDPSVQWVQEDKVTLFTTDGLIQIGGNFVPQRISDKKRGKVKIAKRVQRYKESDYMDPHQVLCLGSLFDIAATNKAMYSGILPFC
ncbi:unnamed protein product [Cuscuta epithymum]|uniref:DUF7811 domain-containing protein n=1 Tax=Cuscuta epithymum TaxID=186058 RepID=A0AAV0FS18_9ASTE|nr:unnamed protein product [Cuscuta epithymum]CAH9138387.1 unnamed protein product [Cuscuta epithymum]